RRRPAPPGPHPGGSHGRAGLRDRGHGRGEERPAAGPDRGPPARGRRPGRPRPRRLHLPG
ncbi:unnamed protein product, partial [Heterosigma akashiwo]